MKIRLRKWVKVVLTLILIFSLIILAGECDTLSVMLIKTAICLVTFSLSAYLLYKYGDINE